MAGFRGFARSSQAGRGLAALDEAEAGTRGDRHRARPPTEVPAGREQGLARDCVVNCDNLFTIRKAALGRRREALEPESLARLSSALLIALDLEAAGRRPDVRPGS
jgi:mRNA-degrading endonuclease toxin of MazEF toxin-antitoxin module